LIRAVLLLGKALVRLTL